MQWLWKCPAGDKKGKHSEMPNRTVNVGAWLLRVQRRVECLHFSVEASRKLLPRMHGTSREWCVCRCHLSFGFCLDSVVLGMKPSLSHARQVLDHRTMYSDPERWSFKFQTTSKKKKLVYMIDPSLEILVYMKTRWVSQPAHHGSTASPRKKQSQSSQGEREVEAGLAALSLHIS